MYFVKSYSISSCQSSPSTKNFHGPVFLVVLVIVHVRELFHRNTVHATPSQTFLEKKRNNHQRKIGADVVFDLPTTVKGPRSSTCKAKGFLRPQDQGSYLYKEAAMKSNLIQDRGL